MRIGVISEGHADRAVITNILLGLTGIDSSDIIALRPAYIKDETDKAFDKSKTISSYSIIRKECEDRQLIDGFLAIEGQDFIVLHIDTAEADRYEVARPDRNHPDYCEDLRNLVIEHINAWLNIDLSNELLYAVAIEEIDAWVLALYEKGDSSRYIDAKKRLGRILSKQNIKFLNDAFGYYWSISKGLSKKKNINNETILSNNCSLFLFCKEVQNKVLRCNRHLWW